MHVLHHEVERIIQTIFIMISPLTCQGTMSLSLLCHKWWSKIFMNSWICFFTFSTCLHTPWASFVSSHHSNSKLLPSMNLVYFPSVVWLLRYEQSSWVWDGTSGWLSDIFPLTMFQHPIPGKLLQTPDKKVKKIIRFHVFRVKGEKKKVMWAGSWNNECRNGWQCVSRRFLLESLVWKRSTLLPEKQ